MEQAIPPHQARAPGDMLGWLHEPGTPSEAKNGLLGQLLHVASRSLAGAGLAQELLILALWPGLSVVRARLRRFDRHGDLDTELVGRLTLCIRQADPSRIRRVAATLLRNVERDIRRDWIADADRARSTTTVEELISEESEQTTLAPREFALRLTRRFGEDGAHLAAVHVAGYSQREIAKRLGVTHDAARKRCQRALARVLAASSDSPVPDPSSRRLSGGERANPRAQSGADR